MFSAGLTGLCLAFPGPLPCVAFGRADQDSVRLLAVETCGAFAQALGRDDAVNSLLPIIHKFAQVGFPRLWLGGVAAVGGQPASRPVCRARQGGVATCECERVSQLLRICGRAPC